MNSLDARRTARAERATRFRERKLAQARSELREIQERLQAARFGVSTLTGVFQPRQNSVRASTWPGYHDSMRHARGPTTADGMTHKTSATIPERAQLYAYFNPVLRAVRAAVTKTARCLGCGRPVTETQGQWSLRGDGQPVCETCGGETGKSLLKHIAAWNR